MKYMHACGFGGTLTFEFNKIVFFFLHQLQLKSKE